jgi:ubiquinone/menaquinone biosynthesis C-methylase UbiE
MEQLKGFFQNRQVSTILDVGTGSGNFIAVIKESIPDAKITGVDPDKDSLNQAASLYPEVIFQEMVGEGLAFADDSFDVASISMALHHLPDVSKTLYEMQRVVKSGGWIIVNELFSDKQNPAQEVHKLIHHFRSKLDRLNGVCHNETFTKCEILDRTEAAGLQILLHFENRKPSAQLTTNNIVERISKLKYMVDAIKDKAEYPEFVKEIQLIEQNFAKYGFEMATRVVIVAQVK